MFEFIAKVFGLGGKAIEKALGKDLERAKEQARINEAEISGAPQSRLRLWRSALGWALAFSFVWEVMARPIILTYWPNATLPPSFIKETTSLLLGMLGMGI